LSENIICSTYGRASTNQQGDTIEHQIDIVQEYIKRENQDNKDKNNNITWILPSDFIYTDEAFSGYKLGLLDRPSMKRLISDAKNNKFQIAIFKSISRIARDTQESLKLLSIFETLNIKVISIEENFNSDKQSSEFFFTIYSALAQEESKKIGIRVSLGNKSKARSGKWSNSRPPIGYKVDKETKKLVYSDNTQHIETIKKIFNLYVNEGLGTFKIAEILNNQQWYTSNNRRWDRSSVAKVIKNRVYIGEIVYGKKRYKPIQKIEGEGKISKTIKINEDDWVVCKNAHPAIIDKEIFYKAQSILNSRNIGQTFKHVIHPLTGILFCSKCKNGFVCQKRSFNNKDYRYYICKTYHKYGRNTCSQANINADELEKFIYDDLLSEIKNYKKHENEINQKTFFAEQSLNKLKKELQECEKNIEKVKKESLNLIKLSDKLTEEQFQYSNDELKNELKNLNDRKQSIQEELVNFNLVNNNEYFKKEMEDFIKNPNPDLRKYFHIFIKEIFILDNEIESIEYNFFS